jgi:hypothetical protein
MYTAYKKLITDELPITIIDEEVIVFITPNGTKVLIACVSDQESISSLRKKIDCHIQREVDEARELDIQTEKIETRNKNVPKDIQNLSDKELREIIFSLKNRTWEEDAPLRILSEKIYGESNVMQMLALAVHLAYELAIRTEDYGPIASAS